MTEHAKTYVMLDGLLRIPQDCVCHIVLWISMQIQEFEDVLLVVTEKEDSMLIILRINVLALVLSYLICLLITKLIHVFFSVL